MEEAAAHDIDGLDALPAGSAIGGYTVRRVIGHGGFGITYEAHNRVTGRAVALKEFFPSSMVRRDGHSRLIYSRVNQETIAWALRKFEETTTTLCGLSHPNIVQVHDYVPMNDTGYMVMELLDGQTLKDWLKARPAPPRLDELRPLVDPVMAALGYVHGRGLVHRDIAPDNILITREGRPVLIDFGSVSRDLSDARQQGLSSTVGLTKRHYTAPEQMRAKARPTVEADVYSMGAVLYRGLTGADPADGQERVDAIFHQKSPDPYAPLAGRLPAGCPARAGRAVDAALALRPEDRTRTVAELRAGLEAPAAAEGPPARSGRWLLAAGLAAALAGLGGAGAGAWWTRGDNAAQQTELARRQNEMASAKADMERQGDAAKAAQAELARRQGEVASAKAEMERQGDAAKAAQAELARRQGEMASAKAEADRQGEAARAAQTELARQQGEVAAARAEADRQGAAAKAERADLARQRDDLAAARVEVDRQNAAAKAAQADLARQRDETAIAKAEVDRLNGAVETASADVERQRLALRNEADGLDQQRRSLAADRVRLEQDRNRTTQASRDDIDRLTKQINDARTSATNLNSQRLAAEADAEGLRSQLADKANEVARLTAVNESLRSSPAAVPPPPAAPSAPALWQRARVAANTFYDKHSFSQGGNVDDLATLYPSDQNIIVNGESKSASDQISQLDQYYRKGDYISFSVRPRPDSLNFSACRSSDDCLVRGVVDASYQTRGNAGMRTSTLNFCLKFRLRGQPKVLAEASTLASSSRDPSCE